MQEILKEIIKAALPEGAAIPSISIDHTPNLDLGDYSTNVALVLAKQIGKNPFELAKQIAQNITAQDDPRISKIDAVAPGFINFYLSPETILRDITPAMAKPDDWGKNNTLAGKKVIVEYSTQNFLKEFHIGHLMSNSIGESLSRLIEFSGAEVKRNNYQSDMSMNIAKAVWGMFKLQSEMPAESADPVTKGAFLGRSYAAGSLASKDDAAIMEEIKSINKALHEHSDEKLWNMYEIGRRWSLEAFEEVYRKIGTHFDFLFAESETAPLGKELVLAHINDGVFEYSDGAVVFKGERYGLHTRVFLNSQGFATYEAKDLALAKMKHDRYPYDLAIIATANEQEAYFKVMKKAMEFVLPDLASKTRHFSHGLLSLSSGKMSSHTGNVITAEEFIASIGKELTERALKEERGVISKGDIVDIAVAAIKYSILKQSPGRNIVFDPQKETSFEGDSGPYLEYSYVRTNSIIEKAKERNIVADLFSNPENQKELERTIRKFPEVVLRAAGEYAPNLLVSYLIELAHVFNGYYAGTKILDGGEFAPYRLALVHAAHATFKNGLYLLGVRTVERM